MNILKNNIKSKRLLIIGAGYAGKMVAQEIQDRPNLGYLPIAFADDNENLKGTEICKIKVIGPTKNISSIVKSLKIDQIVITMPTVSGDPLRRIVHICEQTKVPFKILPGAFDVLDSIESGKPYFKFIRNIQIEDLLRRKPLFIKDISKINYIQGKCILVTGAGGSIGSELCRQIAELQPKEIVLFDHSESSMFEIDSELRNTYNDVKIIPVLGSICDKQKLIHTFRTYKPNVVFHAAAYKHVPLLEYNPAEAIKTNIIGSQNLILAAHNEKIERFVLISTDKAVNPSSTMGATKRISEMFMQGIGKNSSTKFVAVRFGNVLASQGSVVPTFKKQIKEGGPVTVTHKDMKRYFMTISEAVHLILQASASGGDGEIFILDMGKQIKIVDLAEDIIRLYGLEPGKDIEIKFTGIRPGEKLSEELLSDVEGLQVTKNDKIYVIKPESINMNKIQEQIKKLEKYSISGQDSQIIKTLKEIVSE